MNEKLSVDLPHPHSVEKTLSNGRSTRLRCK